MIILMIGQPIERFDMTNLISKAIVNAVKILRPGIIANQMDFYYGWWNHPDKDYTATDMCRYMSQFKRGCSASFDNNTVTVIRMHSDFYKEMLNDPWFSCEVARMCRVYWVRRLDIPLTTNENTPSSFLTEEELLRTSAFEDMTHEIDGEFLIADDVYVSDTAFNIDDSKHRELAETCALFDATLYFVFGLIGSITGSSKTLNTLGRLRKASNYLEGWVFERGKEN